MRTEATVVEIRGSRAVVTTERLSACEGCHKATEGEGCSVCTLMGGNRTVSAEAENPLGAKVGDRVMIESRTGRMLWYAALVFLLPILLAIAVTSFFGFLCMIATVQRNFLFLLASCIVGFACCILLTPPLLSAASANGASYSLILSTVAACLILAIGIFGKLLHRKEN